MIARKSAAELDIMRKACSIAAAAQRMLAELIRPGISTLELDQAAEAFISSQGARPSFKGYDGFPASICVSVNNELVHGIPGSRILLDGDIVSVDVGVEYNGYHGDTAWTYGVGAISAEARKLLEATERALYAGISAAKPGVHLYTISYAIQRSLEDDGFSVVREYSGHGIGRELHEEPLVPNFGPPGRGPLLSPGNALAIEPMASAGERYVRTLDDQWTVVTVDGSLCAHFEHTTVITEDGCEILTM